MEEQTKRNDGASVSVELGRRVIRDLVVGAQCHRDVEEALRSLWTGGARLTEPEVGYVHVPMLI